jgi:hypothetical protein
LGKNLLPIAIEVDSIPRVVFTSEVDIPKGTELFYDYNDRRKMVVAAYPWMINDNYIPPTDVSAASNFRGK